MFLYYITNGLHALAMDSGNRCDHIGSDLNRSMNDPDHGQFRRSFGSINFDSPAHVLSFDRGVIRMQMGDENPFWPQLQESPLAGIEQNASVHQHSGVFGITPCRAFNIPPGSKNRYVHGIPPVVCCLSGHAKFRDRYSRFRTWFGDSFARRSIRRCTCDWQPRRADLQTNGNVISWH